MTDESEDFVALSHYQRRIRYGERLGLVLRVYTFAGVFLAAGGALYLLYSRLEISLTEKESIALALTVSGVILSITTYGFMSYRKSIYERDIKLFAEQQAAGRFLEAWARFEQGLRNAARKSIADVDQVSLREIISRLRAESRLSVSDQIAAENLLQIRNSLVHRARRYSSSDLEQSLNRIIDLLGKVE